MMHGASLNHGSQGGNSGPSFSCGPMRPVGSDFPPVHVTFWELV